METQFPNEGTSPFLCLEEDVENWVTTSPSHNALLVAGEKVQ